jgi:hypothetical protein
MAHKPASGAKKATAERAEPRERPPAKGAASDPAADRPAAERVRQRARGGFLAALANDFKKHGAAAIREAREGNPATYLRLVATLLKEAPRERPLDDLTDEELAAAIAKVRSLIAEQDGEPGPRSD